MLTIRDLRISAGGRTLFENAAMTVNYGERVALVGPNGAGKSTLFSVILQRERARRRHGRSATSGRWSAICRRRAKRSATKR